MNVYINFGRHAGEVRDIAPEAALAMLADGRASRPHAEDEPTGEIALPMATLPEELAEVQPRRRRSRR